MWREGVKEEKEEIRRQNGKKWNRSSPGHKYTGTFILMSFHNFHS